MSHDALPVLDGVPMQGLVARLSALGLDDADLAPGPELVDALLRLGRYDEARGVATARRADEGARAGV